MVVQVMPRIARQNGDGSDQDHGKSMLEAPHRVDQRVRLDERRSIEVEVREEEGSKEAEELRMRRRHPIAGTEAIRGTRLLEETLETQLRPSQASWPIIALMKVNSRRSRMMVTYEQRRKMGERVTRANSLANESEGRTGRGLRPSEA